MFDALVLSRCDKYGRDIARSELNYEFYDVVNLLD